MKKLIVAALIAAVSVVALPAYAKGGGGRAGGGGARARTTTTSRPSAPAKPSAPKPAKPATPPKPKPQIVKSTTNKTVAGKRYSKNGKVVGNGYAPRYGGYVPPPGATVYVRDNGIWDWLPFYLIMTHQSHREVVVTEPASGTAPAKEVVVKEDGIDTMYVINWIVSILIALGIIGGLSYLIARRYAKS